MFCASSGETIFVKSFSKVPTFTAPPFMRLILVSSDERDGFKVAFEISPWQQVGSGYELINRRHTYLTIWFKIILASPAQTWITEITRGEDLLMSSLAKRMAAIMEAAMTSVEANRSLICRWRSS